MNARRDRRVECFIALLIPVLIWSAVDPHDQITWWLESAPTLLLIPVLYFTRHRLPLSSLLLTLLWLHGLLLLVGGHYTYALTPLGEWAQDWFHWQRNHYDKLGHFFQGLVPALACREIVSRASPLRGHAGWIGYISVATAMMISALYELIEWIAALLSAEAAESFLGTQGDVWDTQSDMAMALAGALATALLLARWHDRSIAAREPAHG